MLRILTFACASTAAAAALAAPQSLTTLAEQTGYQRTGRYEEVERLCKAYAAQWPRAVRCFEFGRSPEGRSMMALAASQTGALSAGDARKKNLPVLLFQGGIHAGEIDGKDAGFLALRALLEKRAAPDALDKLVFVFVPVFSVDGHERFGRWNRPNQNGPEEMGWRATAQNLNLNRDYAKAEAPEMQAMLRLLNAWDPILYVDLHSTDGARFQHDISVEVEPRYLGDPDLQRAGTKLMTDTNDQLAAEGALPVDFYPSLRDPRDPLSGFSNGTRSPRASIGYWALHNRFAALVETHSWNDYATRVHLTYNTIIAMTELAVRNGQTWLKTAAEAEERARKLGGSTVALNFKGTDRHRMIDFRGYAYTRDPSEISGGLALRYDPSTPQIWRVPLYTEVVPSLEIMAPKGGYIVPAAHAAWLKAKLDLHGIEYRILSAALEKQDVETFHATQARFAPKSYEARMTADLTGEWKREPGDIPAGSLFVPIAQRNSRLAIALLEPRAPDSFAAWGFFNAYWDGQLNRYPVMRAQRIP